MKRLIFCFDGTWNKIDSAYPTNVARIAQSVRLEADGVRQIVHYDDGVGTTRLERILGGGFGYGVSGNIAEAYGFLVLNYEQGDEIYVFGFSRGAFTARSFVGLLRNCGIMSRRSLSMIGKAMRLYYDRSEDTAPDSEPMRQFRYEHCPEYCVPGDAEWRRARYPGDSRPTIELRVKYLGVWDTVGALGVPGQLKILSWLYNRAFRFHDHKLSTFVEAARHAIAADERRRTFRPTLWENLTDLNAPHKVPRYLEMVFPGTHGAVGGGGPVRGLSDGALEWVMEGARPDLAFDTSPDSPVFGIRPDHRAALFNQVGKTKEGFGEWAMGLGLADRRLIQLDVQRVHDSLVRRFAEPAEALPEKRTYRPRSLEYMWSAIGARGAAMEAQAVEQKGAGAPLATPARIVHYVVEPGDTLGKIAGRHMGGKQFAGLLFEHNRMLGRVFDANRIYAGQELEIPVYADAKAVEAAPAAT